MTESKNEIHHRYLCSSSLHAGVLGTDQCLKPCCTDLFPYDNTIFFPVINSSLSWKNNS